MAGGKVGTRGPRWAVAAVTAGGLGLAPWAPGTFGAAGGVLLYLPALALASPWSEVLAAAELLVAVVVALVAIPQVLRATGMKDPSFVVVDEVAGMLAALLWISPSLTSLALAFALFRILDILKPFPINRLERIPGAWGVLLDDIAAGLCAGFLADSIPRMV